MIPIVDEVQVKSACKPGRGVECCSFLMMGVKGWMCAKSTGNEIFLISLSERRESNTIRAMGDNCEGWNPE